MASFKICILEHQKRASDNKYPVSIRVTWKRKSAYIKTDYYVLRSQLTKSLELKDADILKILTTRINDYERLKVQKIGANIDKYTARELADYFVKHTKNNVAGGIDFFAFCEQVAAGTKNAGTAGVYRSIVNSFKKFTNRNYFNVHDLNARLLEDYERWMVDDHNFSPSGLNLYMRTMRTLFYKARNFYNDEDKGEVIISHNPFVKYKIKQTPVTGKRNIKPDIIVKIWGLSGLNLRREILARDVFMLSFFMLGSNTADIYNATIMDGGRIVYNRTKTESRRQDRAVISIKIIPEMLPYMDKYADKTGARVFAFYRQYANFQNFNKAVNLGLEQLSKRLDLPVKLSSYYARHSFATIARNVCGVSMLDVHEALNHAHDAGMKTTDIYIERDWTVLDRVQEQVSKVITSHNSANGVDFVI